MKEQEKIDQLVARKNDEYAYATMSLWMAIKSGRNLFEWWKLRRQYVRTKKWVEFNGRWGFRLMFHSCEYGDDGRPCFNIQLFWGSIWLYIPLFVSKYRWDSFDAPQYGVYWYGESGHHSLVFAWSRKTYHLFMPWNLKWYRTSRLLVDGQTWEHEFYDERADPGQWQKNWDLKKNGGHYWSQVYPYTYTLRNGTVQNRMATLHQEQWEWRPSWLMWTDRFNFVRTWISIRFDGEVGERTGSWKGGTVGCSFDMEPNETPEEALRRMEATRIFK
ncbi:hypothetical protein CLV58_12552 [Spirosoma oryzae]|uniref:Uncharacterized protein n=1 Tax=Spirosoma oryzae TaxID=1469603 RepID=A0A2T0S8N9_9BACT|nr:hypothetical protein [Spirosoma oryzae]PRY29790.1 hypothetical protein CLV58_12552 [Spirosoma oryzae]